MKHKIGLALACLWISALLYLLLGVLIPIWMISLVEKEQGSKPPNAWLGGVCMFSICAVLAVAMLVVAWGIQRRKFWGWVAGLCVFGVFLPSAFFPLGALGLWGLLDRGSRSEFGVGAPGTPAG